MKRLYTLLIALIAMTAAGVAQSAGSVEINAANFPDERFRNFVTANYDTNGDGNLDETEAAAVTSINISSKGIADLKGIEFFTALQTLVCLNNRITRLDLSKNTALKSLDCYINKLTALDLSKNTALEILNCQGNLLTTLDLSKNTALKYLQCGSNQLTSLDVSGCPYLKTIRCDVNKISGVPMTAFVLSLCDRTGTDAGEVFILEISRDDEQNVCTSAQVAIAKGKNWTVKAWNPNTNREDDYAGSASGTSAKVAINKTNFPDEKFRNFVIANYDKNGDGALSETELAVVNEMYFGFENITDLKGIEYFAMLKKLTCWFNKLTKLDVSKNTLLTELDCSSNQLTRLDVSGCTALEKLYCSYNQLGSLDVSGCPNLWDLYCDLNKINGDAMTALVNSLSDRTGRDAGTIRLFAYPHSNEENVCTSAQVGIAKGKNWTVKAWNYNKYRSEEYFGSDYVPPVEVAIDETNFLDENFRNFVAENYDADRDGVLSEAEIAAVISMNVTYKDFASLKGVEHFTALKELYCYGNKLAALDVSGCTALERLECEQNKISGDAMTALVNSLSDRTGTDAGYINLFLFPDAAEENVCTSAQVAIAKAKNWTVYAFNWDSKNYEEYLGSDYVPPVEVAIDETNFPDENFRNFVSESYDADHDGVLNGEEIAAVTSMNVSYKRIQTLKGIEHFSALKWLSCYGNWITSLDVSKNTALTQLNCYNNFLTSLDVSGCTALEYLDCHHNDQLSALDVSTCTALKTLDCWKNALTSLDVSKNTLLTRLSCTSNALTELDLKANTLLTYLACSNNQLSALDVSACPSLKEVYCYSNKINGDAMTALVASLGDRTGADAGFINLIASPSNQEENVCTTVQVAIAKGKNWRVTARNLSFNTVGDYAGSEPTAIRNLETSDGTASAAAWYSIDGKKLPAEPTQRGVYIHGGRKVVK